MPEPENFTSKPVSYILRATTILRFLGDGRRTARDVSDATALPLTTVIRMAAEMQDEHVLSARIVGSQLWLAVRYRHPSMVHLND